MRHEASLSAPDLSRRGSVVAHLLTREVTQEFGHGLTIADLRNTGSHLR